MYERPRFVRSAELREACDKLPPGDTLHAFLARGFWKLHSLHHPAHKCAVFKQDLNYQWLHYTFDDAAAELFWANFDDHAGQQETNYRLDQQAAKKAGKGKTRHYRLAMPLHNLMQKAAGIEPNAWNFQVSHAAAKASVLFSTYMDEVFSCLDLLRRKAAAQPAAPNAGLVQQAAPGDRRRGKSALEMRLQATLSANVDSLLPPEDREVVLTMARAVCVSQKAQCMRHSDVRHLRPVIVLQLEPERLSNNSPRALRLLHLLGLGTAALSTNATGAKCVFFTKLPQERLEDEAVQASIRALKLAAPFQTAPLPVVLQHKKANQPEVVFPSCNDAAVAETMAATVRAISG